MPTVPPPPSPWLRVLGGIAIVFGLATLAAGSRTLFGGASSPEGQAVPFVVWFNTLAGLGYVAAGLGLVWLRRWSAPLAIALGVSTALIYALFGLHVALGGVYGTRTVYAMALRTAFWTFVAYRAHTAFRRPRPGHGEAGT